MGGKMASVRPRKQILSRPAIPSSGPFAEPDDKSRERNKWSMFFPSEEFWEQCAPRNGESQEARQSPLLRYATSGAGRTARIRNLVHGVYPGPTLGASGQRRYG